VTAPSSRWRRRVADAIDRRLGSAGRAVGGPLAAAVLAGAGQSAAVVVQAVLLATVIERSLEHGAGVASVRGPLIGLGVALAARGLLGWVGEWAAGRAVVLVTARLRSDLLTAALERGPSWLAGERAGELALTATSGAEAVGVYVGRYLPQLVLAVLAPVGVLAWVGATDWISLLLLAALVALVPPTMRVFLRRAAEATEREWRGLSSLSAHLLELVQGLPTLRAFGRVDYGRREVAEASERLRRSTLRTLRVAFLSSLSLELLAGLGTGLVAMVLGLRLLGGHTSLYVALAVLLVSPEVFLPLRRASAEFHAAAAGRTAGERIAAVVAGGSGTPSGGAAPPGVGAVGVSFEGATVVYADRASPALDGLTLAIEPGRRVALVGPSGSGKSTALHALVALVPLRAGRILVDGADLASLDAAAWRARVAWVPQRPYVFSGTLRENLALANPGADPAALDAAVAVAGLGEVARRLPDGLDTVLGERGATLSSGERHRVAIARAVLHGGDLVLLDEVGSHLDPDARDRLAETLGRWLAGRTVLLAAHHPDDVVAADEVVVLGSAVRT